MKTIHMMIGIPGSGKTTFVNKFSKERNIYVVSTDIVRMSNPGILESDVWPRVYKMIGEILDTNDEVIFDATNVTKKVRDRFKENVNKYITDYEIIGYYFPTNYTECIKRVAKRNESKNELFLPLDVIESYGKTIYPPMPEENFKEVKVISMNNKLIKNLVSDGYQGYALYFKHNDEVIEEYGGFARIGSEEAIKENTNFRLASVSKQFISYAILTLVEKGLISLNDSLFSFFTDMPLYTKNITLLNMLNHTSGLYDYEDMLHTDEQIHDVDVLEYIKGTNKTYFEVGTKYQYSNTAYVLLGLIIEKVSQTKLGEYMKEYVFDKFGMNNTVVNYEPVTNIFQRALGHIVQDGHYVMKDQYWCSATIGDGGIYSSVLDLKKWLKNIMNLQYPYSLMTKTNICLGNDIEYGLGLRVKEYSFGRVIYHCGETIGTNTIIGFIKELNIEFIFLTNKDNIDASLLLNNIIECISEGF